MDKLVATINDPFYIRKVVPSIWEKTVDGPLRTWMLDLISSDITADDVEQSWADLSRDALRALFAAKLRGSKGVDTTDKCAYHVHEDEVRCA